MAENRTPRDTLSREKTVRKVYKPTSSLPDPTPEPGYSYRWVATHVLGQADPTNTSRKFRDGWTPVKAEDHPELMLVGNTTGNVEIGGLILCKMATDDLAAIKGVIGDLDRIKQIVRVVGYVASVPTFTQQPAVVNGASELLLEIFGENGKHARSAVGMAVLPLNASVEIELTVEVE